MLLMAGGVVILEDEQTMVVRESTAVLVGIIRCKFIFRSATLSPPYKQSNTPVRFYPYPYKKIFHCPKRHFQSPKY
jgi:hypothetical protein